MPSGNLYRTTWRGGDGRGTVFSKYRGHGTVASRSSASPGAISGGPHNGDVTSTPTATSRNNLRGGANGYGIAFEIVHGANTITTLSNFTLCDT